MFRIRSSLSILLTSALVASAGCASNGEQDEPTEPTAAAASALSLNPSATQNVSLQSFSYPDRYIRVQGAFAELTPIASSADAADGTFVAGPGLAGGGTISFQSVSHPGYYLRHQSFRLQAQVSDGSAQFQQDASFTPRAGLADTTATSLEAINYPGYFIRQTSFDLYLNQNDGSDGFHKDATFRALPPVVATAQYAPLVMLASGEPWLPSSVEYFAPNLNVWCNGSPVATSVVGIPAGALPDDQSQCLLRTKIALSSPYDQSQAYLHGQDPSQTSVPVYVSTYAEGPEPNVVNVQYMMFYPYNLGKPSPLDGNVYDDHIGDWEGMTIQLTDGQPTAVRVGAHSSDSIGNTYRRSTNWTAPDGSTLQWSGTHPVVYSAYGSHGVWATPGSHTYEIILSSYPLTDDTSSGIAWSTWNNVVTISASGQIPSSAAWFGYKGRWGNAHMGIEAAFSDEYQLNDGPTTPPPDRDHALFYNIDVPGQSALGAPALATYNGRLYMAYRDGSGSGMYLTSFDSSHWSTAAWTTPTLVPGQTTSAAPALAVYNGLLYLVYRDGAGSGMYYTTFNGSSWGGGGLIPGQTTSTSPALATFSGNLYLAYRDSAGNSLHYATFNGSSWSGPGLIPNQTTSAAPALATYGDLLYLAYRDGAGSGLYHTSFDGSSWGDLGLFTSGVVQTSSTTPAIAPTTWGLGLVYPDGNGSGKLWSYAYWPPSNGTQYRGCYVDSATRALPYRLINGGATVRSCTAAAQQAGYAYAGLQAGGECWVGNTLGQAHASESDCNMPCTANTADMCGAGWRNSIWYVPAATNQLPTTFTATLQNASRDGTTNQCLIFDGNGQSTNPDRYLWGGGDDGYCGTGSKATLLNTRQALWTFRSIGGDLYTITNASRNGSTNECLIFSGNGQSPYPERFLWGGGDNGYCGQASTAQVFANKQAVWKLTSLGGDLYTISNASLDGSTNECLIFSNNGQDTSPSRFLWGGGDNGYCGLSSVDELIAKKQAVWSLTIRL